MKTDPPPLKTHQPTMHHATPHHTDTLCPTQLDLTQIDKLERDLFVSKIESALPPTEAEEHLLSKSLEHADLRLVDGLRVEKCNSFERELSVMTPIPSGVVKKQRKTVLPAAGFAKTFTTNRDQKKWKRIQGGDEFAIKKYTKFVKDDAVKWGKATTLVHTSSEEALAWLWYYCSNERMRRHQKENGNILRNYYDPEMQQRGKEGIIVDESQGQGEESRTRHVVVRKMLAKRIVEMRESNFKFVW